MGDGAQPGLRMEGGEPRTGASWRGTFAAMFFILGILWGAVFVALRTEGGLGVVRKHLSELLSDPVNVERASLVFPLTLRLEGVQSADYVQGTAGFRVSVVRVRPGWRPRWQLALEAPEVNLHPAGGGGWRPAALSVMGDLPAGDVQDLSALCAGWRSRWRLGISGGHLRWFTIGGAPLADVQGLSFLVAPVKFPDRLLHVHRLVIERVNDGGDDVLSHVELEWLADDTGRFVELTRSPGVPPADGAGFWSVDHGQTRQD